MNLCKDCKWAENDYPATNYNDELYSENSRADSWWCRFVLADAIAGPDANRDMTKCQTTAWNMRFSGPCGYDGRFWEART